MARNYQQAKIYMICNGDKDCIPYIGSSCKRLLSQRMNQHRDDYKKWKRNPEKYSYISSFTLFEKFGIENCYIELIQAYPCNTSDELRARERRWINDIKCVNINKPFVSKEERIEINKIYREEHKEEIAERDKIYREEHKEEIAERKKIYYDEHKEEIAEKGKIYCNKHKEEIIEKNKIKYQKNKKLILEKMKETFTCNCGSTLRIRAKVRHEKSKKHQNYLSAIGTLCTTTVTESL